MLECAVPETQLICHFLKSCIRVLHIPIGIVGVLEMGMKVCLRGITLEFHLYVYKSIYFESINLKYN